MPRARRVCAVPGCPKVQAESKCPEHRREAERARGSSTARGYGKQHQRERAQWAPLVATGTVQCRRCREVIAAGEPWDLGHPDAECPRPKAPEHRDRCNRAAGGRSAMHPVI